MNKGSMGRSGHSEHSGFITPASHPHTAILTMSPTGPGQHCVSQLARRKDFNWRTAKLLLMWVNVKISQYSGNNTARLY